MSACAIYDRAAAKLVATPLADIVTLVDLTPALTDLNGQLVPL